jgi:hypothetical protein
MLSREIEPKPEDSFEDPCVPPVRFLELQSFICHSSRRLLGYLRRRAEICFHTQRDFSSNRPPILSKSGLFSHVLSPLRSFFADPPGHSFRRSQSGQSFFPFRDNAGAVYRVREYTFSR